MDFFNHLLDAPLSNVLIVAGLLFLGIAAVGKVVGKIEPDKIGRIVSGLLGLVLLVVGISIHAASDSKKDHAKGEQSTPSQPIIRVFSVTPAHITEGGTVTIQWEVLNADSVELEPFGKVTAAGRTTDEPRATTMYRLSATNSGGGKQGAFQQIFVNPRPQPVMAREPASRAGAPAPRRVETARVPASVPEPPVNSAAPVPRPVPNFAGTWKQTEYIRNGIPSSFPANLRPRTITQTGAIVHLGNLDLPISDDGKITRKVFLAEGYENGRPTNTRRVDTEAEAAVVSTTTSSIDGTTLVDEITTTYKAPYFGHPLGTERSTMRFQRVSASASEGSPPSVPNKK